MTCESELDVSAPTLYSLMINQLEFKLELPEGPLALALAAAAARDRERVVGRVAGARV